MVCMSNSGTHLYVAPLLLAAHSCRQLQTSSWLTERQKEAQLAEGMPQASVYRHRACHVPHRCGMIAPLSIRSSTASHLAASHCMPVNYSPQKRNAVGPSVSAATDMQYKHRLNTPNETATPSARKLTTCSTQSTQKPSAQPQEATRSLGHERPSAGRALYRAARGARGWSIRHAGGLQRTQALHAGPQRPRSRPLPGAPAPPPSRRGARA